MKYSLHALLLGAMLTQAIPAWAQAPAQSPEFKQPIYRCADGKGAFTYTHVPCANAKVIGEDAPKPKTAASRQPVPQDRARLATRGQLSPEDRAQCTALETQIADQQAALKAKAEKGEAVSESEEGVLVRQRMKYREMKC